MVSVLDSGSSGRGSGPWPGILCCVLGQDTLLPRCLSSPRCINGYRRNAGGNPAMDWHPIQGGVKNTPSRLMLRKPGISTGVFTVRCKMYYGISI